MIVVNKRSHRPTPKDVYIGRPGIFGNPFPVQTFGRAAALENYREWLFSFVLTNPDHQLFRAIRDLPEDAVLVCFCKPADCHGDVIIQLHERLKEEDMKTWRTLLEVTAVTASGVVEATLPAWKPRVPAYFPVASLPAELRQGLRVGTFLFAQVNIGAEQPADLVFSEFEFASYPVPEVDRKYQKSEVTNE